MKSILKSVQLKQVALAAFVSQILLTVCCGASCAVSSADELKTLLAADPVLSEFSCEGSLKQVLLDLGRKTGGTFIFDDAFANRVVCDRFANLSACAILARLSAKYNFDLDCIAKNTFLVQQGTPVAPDCAEQHRGQPVAGELNDSLTALAASSTESLAVSAVEPTSVTLPPRHVVLEGGIRLSERLPPVDDALRAGSVLTEKKMQKLEALVPDNQWARLPNWSGGKWKTRGQSNYYRYSYQHKSKDFSVDTFEYRANEGLGYQTDRQGNLWEWDRANYWTKAETNAFYVFDFHRSLETKYKDEKEFTEHFVSTRVVVERKDLRVLRTYQTESIQNYTSPQPGTMRCRASMKRFDEKGLPLELVKGVSYAIKVKEYTPIVKCRGENLPKLFAQYLRRNGLEHLIPVGAE